MNIEFDPDSLSPYVTFMPSNYYLVAFAVVVTYMVFVTVVSETFSKTAAVSAENRKNNRRQKLWTHTKISTTKYVQVGKEFERQKEPILFRTVEGR